MTDEVCIVGAGPSGLISAKLCLDSGLKPLIIEKTAFIGGIWKGQEEEIGAWDSLTTNTTKTYIRISDHPWPKDTPEYPTRNQVHEYYMSYASKHELFQYIKFNTSVSAISRADEGYLVTYIQNEISTTQYYKYVIIATGFYSRLKDEIINKEAFSGKVIHSAYYREPSIFANKKVVVVGNAYSSCDIANEAAGHAESVVQIYKRPIFGMARYRSGIPYDFYMFNILERNNPFKLMTSKQLNSENVRNLEKLFGNPGEIIEQWRITDEEINQKFQNFSFHLNEYYTSLRNGKIQCVRGEAKELTQNSVLLDNGQEIPADVVVIGTGYYTNFDYFSDEIKEILKYDPINQKNTLALYRTCLHPDLKGLAFVGNFHGPFPAQFEILGEVAVRWITGRLNVSESELLEGINTEIRARTELRDANFIYNLGTVLIDYLRILEINIDYDFLEQLGYRNGPFCSVFFWKERPGQEEMIREFVQEMKEKFPEYDFNKPQISF